MFFPGYKILDNIYKEEKCNTNVSDEHTVAPHRILQGINKIFTKLQKATTHNIP